MLLKISVNTDLYLLECQKRTANSGCRNGVMESSLKNDEIPTEYHQQVIHTLSILSELQEISFHTHSLLPHSMRLSRISYLEITRIGTEDTDLSDCLIQLIHRNQHTIRGLKLDSFFIIFQQFHFEYYKILNI